MKMQKEKLIRAEKIKYQYPEFQDENLSEGENPQNKSIQKPALNLVDLEVAEGQFICILGSNGSGKSTLARHLNALLLPDEGTVWIGDLTTSEEKNIWDIRSLVGMVFQNPDNQMIASQIDEEVAFGLENLGVASEEIVKRVSEALTAVGMEDYAKENPANLSGGQKQRIAVAGILAMKPKCIVLDESTAMLDPKGRKEIMDTVHMLNEKFGITIICITHFMEEAIHADKIFVMHEGSIVLSGSPKAVFSHNEEICSAGLQLPMISQLANRLREKGFDLPTDILTEDELLSALKRS